METNEVYKQVDKKYCYKQFNISKNDTIIF